MNLSGDTIKTDDGWHKMDDSVSWIDPIEHSRLVFGSSTYTPVDGTYTINGATLTPGGVMTVSGTAISLAPNGVEVIIVSSTESLVPSMLPTAFPILAFQDAKSSAGAFVIDGRTLFPGQAARISGAALSIADDGEYAVIGSSTKVLLVLALTSCLQR